MVFRKARRDRGKKSFKGNLNRDYGINIIMELQFHLTTKLVLAKGGEHKIQKNFIHEFHHLPLIRLFNLIFV
jgi:hypothetical protein